MGNTASEGYAEAIQGIINSPDVGMAYECIRTIQSPHHEWQGVTYIPSNLGQGHIFYFVCSSCQQKAKFIYFPFVQMKNYRLSLDGYFSANDFYNISIL